MLMIHTLEIDGMYDVRFGRTGWQYRKEWREIR
jgi:hypothetical protein